MAWFPSRLRTFFISNGREYMTYRYDVFMSFRGRDVRGGFVSHLHHALTSAGFTAFLDTHNLNRGDDISASLRHAIEGSRVLIPIFSSNYAQSVWCLREASLIARQAVLRQRHGKGLAIVFPLFYDVTPSQVRQAEQCGGPFAEAFQEHESNGRYSEGEISEWKASLVQMRRSKLLDSRV